MECQTNVVECQTNVRANVAYFSPSSHAFGQALDLHSGGIDLKFPHHENEEAQCCAFFDANSWVGHWLHIGKIYFSDQ